MTQEEKLQALEDLREAADQFMLKVVAFKKQVNPRTVGLYEFCEHIEEVLCDLQADIYADEE